MLDELRAAIEGADWSSALTTALAWWREVRAPELAELVEVLGVRVMPPPPPRREVHAWWMLHAQTYNPITISALVARAHDREHRSDRKAAEIRAWFAGNSVIERLLEPYGDDVLLVNLNAIDRLAVMTAWPDDPRATRIYARWFVDGSLSWSSRALGGITRGFYRLLIERLVALGDVRADEWLASTVVEPRGHNEDVRRLQSEGAELVLRGLTGRAGVLAPDAHAQIVAWNAALAVPVDDHRVREEQALWDEIVNQPDELAPRLVLADALIEQNDPRGQVIALQCNAADERARYEAKRLVDEHWHEWLGEAALVIDRLHSEFERGMLAIATAGTFATPAWAYRKLAGHRELAAIRWLKCGYNITPEQFLGVLADLPRPPARITIDVPLLEAMHLHGPWTIREVELRYRLRDANVLALLDRLGEVFPALTWLGVRMRRADAVVALCAVVPQLPARFPALERVELASRTWQWQGTRADCALAPAPG